LNGLYPWQGLDSRNNKLCQALEIVVSSDSVVLDDCTRWVNLAAELVTKKVPLKTVIDLSPGYM